MAEVAIPMAALGLMYILSNQKKEPQPIVEVEVYQFACMKYLEQSLNAEDYDKVRIALGLETKLTARQKGVELSRTMVNDISDSYQSIEKK